ncbi:hypothetical protein [Waltera sp.]|uniref:hypothetical protein n=1 Tax=Waltera sp. TaxID=2815806 RepID=UPI003AB70FAE
MQAGNRKIEIVPGEGAVKGEAYMRDDFIDRKIRKMAEAERMAVPESLDAKVENILDGLETEKKDSKNTDGKRVNQTVCHYGFRRIVIPAAACLLLASVTVTASGLYRARMESMNHEKLETYFSGLQDADVAADSYSRPLTDGEKNRLEELRQAYLEEGYFPQKELAMLDSPEKYKKGVAFYAARSTFFLPEEEMTEEELLELIDFREKRDYSLAKITEEIEAGDYEYVKTEDSAVSEEMSQTEDSVGLGEMSQTGRSQQEQGTGAASVVLGADTAAQEWQIAYAGELSIRCAVAAEQGLYVGGFTMEGKARVEYLAYGSGTPEKFYDDFDEDGEVYSLCIAPDGSVYAALRGLASPGAEHGRLPVIYHISPEGTLLDCFAAGDREWNIVDSMATDAQGRLYTRMRMQEDGGYVRIYTAEGDLIGTMADDGVYAVQGAGALGQGKDGKVYAAALATENVTAEDDPVTLVSVDPERLCFLPVQGDATENAKAVQSTGTIYQWNMVAAGVSDGSDFILWGYSGVDTYRLEDAEFTRAQEVWEMPCGTEGTCAVIVPDGRILYIGATGGVQGQTAAGVDISGKDPAKTYFYYEPLK